MDKEGFLSLLLNSYYKVRDGYFLAFPNACELQVRHVHVGQSLARIAANENETWLKDVFGELDGTRTLQELMVVVPEPRREDCLKIAAALRRSFLVESATPIPDNRSWRDSWLPHLMGTRQVARHFYEAELADANILVLGAGMIGSRLVTGLMQLGVGHVAVVDTHRVTEDDRFHSMAFAFAELGVNRAEALADSVNAMAGETRVAGHEYQVGDYEGLARLFAGRTMVLVAEDAFVPALYEQVNTLALAQDIPWSMIVIDGWNVYVGPTFLPGHTGCYTCLEQQRQGWMANPETYQGYVQHLMHSGTAGALAISPTFADIAAGMLVSDLPNVIGNMPQRIETESSLTLNRYLHLDMRTFDGVFHPLVKQPRCAVCTGQVMQ